MSGRAVGETPGKRGGTAGPTPRPGTEGTRRSACADGRGRYRDDAVRAGGSEGELPGARARHPRVLEGRRRLPPLARRTARGAPLWMFYEGPPTANGKPGVHHVEPRTFKDVYPRFKTMTGHLVPRKGGWDCHGLPVELEVEKEIGTTGKRDIEAFGIAEFNERCRESVQRYVGEFERLTERIGYWIDLDDAYWTMDTEYIESVWWSLKSPVRARPPRGGGQGHRLLPPVRHRALRRRGRAGLPRRSRTRASSCGSRSSRRPTRRSSAPRCSCGPRHRGPCPRTPAPRSTPGADYAVAERDGERLIVGRAARRTRARRGLAASTGTLPGADARRRPLRAALPERRGRAPGRGGGLRLDGRRHRDRAPRARRSAPRTSRSGSRRAGRCTSRSATTAASPISRPRSCAGSS